jgi:hypothetical protein
MAFALAEEMKRRAEERCTERGHLEVYDPSTVIPIDGRALVLARDKPTGCPLWLELSGK